MLLPSDDDEPTYDDPTAEELEWQALEARLDEHHEECWESVFGEVLEEVRRGAMNDAGFSDAVWPPLPEHDYAADGLGDAAALLG